MSGVVPASIETIVNDLQDITWEQVVFEAVTNSLQANATEINIKLNQFSLEISDKRYIDQLVIEDNGDGFIQKNIESFQNYRSQFKKNLGCKGIGRFLYLKVFEKVQIKSLDKQIDFVINKDIEVNEVESKSYLTEVSFNKVKKQFTVNYDKLEQDLKDHFIAYFRLITGKKKVTINIFENGKIQKTILSTQIPKFETIKFKIHTHEFILDYVFNDETIKHYDGFYCADGRVVIKNSHLEQRKKFNFFKNINILFLLSSKYFDNNVNTTRDDLTIMPVKTSRGLFEDISWQDIHLELASQIKLIAKKHEVDIDKEDITDIVIIELKKPDDKITPARAEEQLIDYASYVNNSRQENKIRVWTYAFLKFNEEIENKLKRKSYNKIPTHSKYPIYYRYWEEPNTIINFLDYSSLAFDAESRNKTFIKILNGETIIDNNEEK